MNVRRIGFLATRTTNDRAMAAFFGDVLGLQPVWSKPGWSGFKLPSGEHDFVEVYGPEKQDAALFPDGAVGAVVAFIVDDLAGAHEEVAAAGVDLLGDLVWAGEGFGWFFLRAPDGNIYCIEQVPD